MRLAGFCNHALVQGRVDKDFVLVARSLLQERVLQQLRRRRTNVSPVLVLVTQAQHHELSSVAALQARQDLRRFTARNFLVDLGRIHTLPVGDLFGEDFQHAHAKGVNVHLLVVGLLLVHVRGHEFRCSKHTEHAPVPVDCTESKVADPQVAGRPVDEDVLTFQVPVDDRWVLRVQVLETLQDLDRPPLGDLPPDHLDLVDEAL